VRPARGAPETGRAERLFLAVTIPSEVRDAIRDALPRSLPGRPVRPEHWHLTLRFLGDSDAARRASLSELLEQAAALGRLGQDFTVRFAGLGAFPTPERARVLWLGASEGASECEALAARVEEIVRAAGFPAERRAFSAHLTLSRLDPPRGVQALVARAVSVATPLAVRAVTLVRSELTPAGPRYTPVTRAQLSAAAG